MSFSLLLFPGLKPEKEPGRSGGILTVAGRFCRRSDRQAPSSLWEVAPSVTSIRRLESKFYDGLPCGALKSRRDNRLTVLHLASLQSEIVMSEQAQTVNDFVTGDLLVQYEAGLVDVCTFP